MTCNPDAAAKGRIFTPFVVVVVVKNRALSLKYVNKIVTITVQCTFYMVCM